MASGLADGLLRFCNGAWRDNDGDAVDIEEVVRCKDCRHGVFDEGKDVWKCVESAEWDEDTGDWLGFVFYHPSDFYCANGEKKRRNRGIEDG